MYGENDQLKNDWHVVCPMEVLASGQVRETALMGQAIYVRRLSDNQATVTESETGRELPVQIKYNFIWACLGTPERDIVHIPEAFEDDRIIVAGGSFGVKASGLRVVENFLDMGHFPFVHTGWLGEEPHTEVAPYEANVTDDDEILATECYFYQPTASPTAEGGIMVEYVYRVYRPYMVALYKTNPTFDGRKDYIVLFIQPVGPEECVAHTYLCYLDDGMGPDKLRWFMQLIFAQDKPILENQLPHKLPLSPRAETPIRADKVAILYRRWLHDHNISYGAIPISAQEEKLYAY
jgi:phenylpropionate dioxygenase-like ring-hydroxylating dioxygenase large terminal subunit